MKSMMIVLVCLSVLLMGSAQEPKKAATPKMKSGENSSNAGAVEAKIRKAWEDYKKKDKAAFAASLADGFAQVTNDADGIIGKDEELADMDNFNLTHFELKDFKFRPVGNAGGVMTYTAQYDGTYQKEPVKMRAVYGEVWVKAGGGWKLLWAQETKLK